MRKAQLAAVIFIALIAAACYIHPVPDDFDRYMYEAIVRSKVQPLERYYPIIRHENRRTEESSAIDTAAHMKEAEALFAVRPLYIDLIYGLSLSGLSIHHAINLISALSLFCTGLIVLLWTESALLSALLMTSWQVMYLGRIGSPDGLSTVLILMALWILEENKFGALTLLFVGLFVRTDSLLLLLVVLAWLAMRKRLQPTVATVTALTAIAIVLWINHWAHHPGWIVLFRLSFIGGSVPSHVAHVLSVREYFTAFVPGAWGLLGQIGFWVFLGVVTWKLSRHPLLLVASVAAIGHFVLYPSPEVRYLLWCCVLVGILFVRSFPSSVRQPQVTQDMRH